MKVLITGGAGFIGSHLAEHLLAAGNSVRVLDNLSTGKRENLPAHPRLEFVQGDIRDRSLVIDTARGMDAIVQPGRNRLGAGECGRSYWHARDQLRRHPAFA